MRQNDSTAIAWVSGLAERFALTASGAILLTTPFALYCVFEKPSISQSFYATFSSVVACSLLLLLMLVTRRTPRRVTVIDLAVVLFASVNFLSVVIRPSLMFGLEQFASLFAFVGFYVLVSYALGVRGGRTKLLVIVAAVGFVVAAYGLMQYLGYEMIGFDRWLMLERFSVVSFLGNPAFVTSYLVPVTFVCLCVGVVSARLSGKIMGFSGVVASITCVFVAGSRSGWLSLIVASVLLVLLWRHIGRRVVSRRVVAALLVAVAVLVLLLGVPNPVMKPRYDIFKRLGSSTQIEARLYAWRIGVEMFARNPILGVGYGNFDVRFWDYVNAVEKRSPSALGERVLVQTKGRSPGHAHNEYVEVLAESGVLGFASFVWLIGACVWRAYRRLRLSEASCEPKAALVSLCLLCAFVALLVDSFFSFPLRLPCSALMFWLLVALLAAGQTERHKAL